MSNKKYIFIFIWFIISICLFFYLSPINYADDFGVVNKILDENFKNILQRGSKTELFDLITKLVELIKNEKLYDSLVLDIVSIFNEKNIANDYNIILLLSHLKTINQQLLGLLFNMNCSIIDINYVGYSDNEEIIIALFLLTARLIVWFSADLTFIVTFFSYTLAENLFYDIKGYPFGELFFDWMLSPQSILFPPDNDDIPDVFIKNTAPVHPYIMELLTFSWLSAEFSFGTKDKVISWISLGIVSSIEKGNITINLNTLELITGGPLSTRIPFEDCLILHKWNSIPEHIISETANKTKYIYILYHLWDLGFAQWLIKWLIELLLLSLIDESYISQNIMDFIIELIKALLD